MAYKKNKEESYDNVGGINQKASVYIVGEREVLDLVNYDFSEPGAWTKRWGFTGAFHGNTVGASFRINNIWQFQKPGIQLAGDLPFTEADSFILMSTDAAFYHYAYSSTGGLLYKTLNFIPGAFGATVGNVNYCVWNNQSYMATGLYMYKSAVDFGGNGYNPSDPLAGPLITRFSVPEPNNASGFTQSAATGGLSGSYNVQLAFKDFLGFIGPKSATLTVNGGTNRQFVTVFGLTSVESVSATNATLFGFASFVLFRDRVDGFASTDMIPYTQQTSIGATSISFGVNRDTSLPGFPVDNQENNGAGIKYLEIYKNRLFMSGSDENPNTVYFSEAGDPITSGANNLENIQPGNNFICSYDKFEVTGMKAYGQSLIISLQRGIFRLTGDSPSNFNVQQINSQYGFISHKAVVEWKERLWFLDENGIVQYNGANMDKISNRLDKTLSRMNIAYARDRAVGYHFETRNEVWFSFPIDNSTNNNFTIVYDYVIDGWTTFTGFSPTGIGEIYLDFDTNVDRGIYSNKKLFFGNAGGSLYFFGSSFMTDDGAGISLSFTTRNHIPYGKSSTAQFRRMFLDTGPSLGATLTFNVAMYPNYSTQTIGLTRTMYSNSPNYRIDFGIPAVALSARVDHFSNNGTVKVYGYVMSSRFQRDVSS